MGRRIGLAVLGALLTAGCGGLRYEVRNVSEREVGVFGPGVATSGHASEVVLYGAAALPELLRYALPSDGSFDHARSALVLLILDDAYALRRDRHGVVPTRAPTAGLRVLDRCLRSDDEYMRRFARRVLADLADPRTFQAGLDDLQRSLGQGALDWSQARAVKDAWWALYSIAGANRGLIGREGVRPHPGAAFPPLDPAWGPVMTFGLPDPGWNPVIARLRAQIPALGAWLRTRTGLPPQVVAGSRHTS